MAEKSIKEKMNLQDEDSRTSHEEKEQRHSQGANLGLPEELLRCRRELDAARSELDAFLHAVSHDLGAPLRAIQGFSRLIVEQYAEKLDEKGQDHLVRIQAAALKIDRMIDELLRMSRLAKVETVIKDVDLSGIARRIADHLGESAPSRDVRFIVADGVHTPGDEQLMTIVLQHLLDNAWKFTGKNDHGVIEFGSGQVGGEQVYFVKDNGIGFDMSYAAGRLFRPFQQLADVREFPGSGSGMGLATVTRIIRRTGGRVWAESEKEKGTTIFFTIG
jgi:light-regulated signal transduction histidine kinase (bacteriophytochrome)